MIYIAGEILKGSCFCCLFPYGILLTHTYMVVERDNNEHTGKRSEKREKQNDIDTGKAVRSNIGAERGFYILYWYIGRALHLKESLLLYIGFSFLYFYYYYYY